MNIRELIPKNKHDIESVEKLSKYSYDDIKSIIPELMEWLQDINWPVAGPMSKYLQSISEYLTDDIVEILRGKDEVWKYWILNVFGLWSVKLLDNKVMMEINRIALNPTEEEKKEEVYDIAMEIIEKNKN